MNTNENYEQTGDDELKVILKQYEELLEKNELEIDKLKETNEKHSHLQEISDDYEIDINIVRMILTKRMWYQETL